MAADKKIRVAICGGGIAGLCLLYGLLKHQHLDVTLYEASSEIAGDEGAGVGLAPNAIRALKLIDPQLVTAAENAESVFVTDPYARVMMVSHDQDSGRRIEKLKLFDRDENQASAAKSWTYVQRLENEVSFSNVPNSFSSFPS